MSQLNFLKVYSKLANTQQESYEFITKGDVVCCHFALFESLQTHKSKLRYLSYADNPHSGRPGDETENALFTCFLRELHKFKCKRGERGVWEIVRGDKNFTAAMLFIEIIDDNNQDMTSRYSQVGRMVNLYASYIKRRRLPSQSSFGDTHDAEELDHYACKVFWHHWSGQNLNLVVPPQNTGVSATADGLQALRELGKFVEYMGPRDVWEGNEEKSTWLGTELKIPRTPALSQLLE